MEIKINPEDRIQIIKNIIGSEYFLGDLYDQDSGIITFLEMIWDLRTMPSTDSRYTNARDDIIKHIVLNDDMTYEDLFLDRLPSTHNDDEKFLKFVNTTVHPTVITNEGRRNACVGFLNGLFKAFHYKFVLVDYFGETPVYKLCDEKSSVDLPKGITPNTIPFFLAKNKNITYPCFVLDLDGWNDWYKWRTLFSIRYYDTNRHFTIIGTVKIMKPGITNTESVLPNKFLHLDSTFCSIGQSTDYYENLKKLFPQECHSILLALNDAAMYPSIRTVFENEQEFINSLLRESIAKQLLDSARYIINDIDVKSYYKFSYVFTPPFTPEENKDDSSVIIDFDFVYNSVFNQRIYAIVGKNGTGKTTFLSKMAHDFSHANPKTIIPQKPLYNKVITISFSFFDRLPLPEANAEFNYSYLGLKGSVYGNDIGTILREKLLSSLNSINEKNRAHIWYRIIRKTFHEDVCHGFVEGEMAFMQIRIDQVKLKYEQFSSGENLLLYIISSVIAEIENGTLILFDEPETHLHPNAVSQLIHSLHLLAEDYNSFCIIATHSPIVIQEITSRNVKIFKRISDRLDVNSIGYETFAENLTTITDEIFGNRDIAKFHYGVLTDIVNDNPTKSYEEIIHIVKNDNIPVPLNIQLFVKELMKHDEKS